MTRRFTVAQLERIPIGKARWRRLDSTQHLGAYINLERVEVRRYKPQPMSFDRHRLEWEVLRYTPAGGESIQLHGRRNTLDIKRAVSIANTWLRGEEL